jgi:succinate-semialdehyde dehydrogenase/glutarate-semialdehyde dehydrogenase
MAGYPELELYIDGRWKRADGQAVLNPADETVLGTVPSATIADLDDAIAAAERGFKVWRKTSPARRTQIILKAASLIRERVNEMAVAMTWSRASRSSRPGSKSCAAATSSNGTPPRACGCMAG